MELTNTFIIEKKSKDIYIGKENNKIIATEAGNKINDFMNQYFSNIIDINFSANLETYLDKIAIGKANWVTILQTFYDMFNPMVENLKKTIINKETILDDTTIEKQNFKIKQDKLLGQLNNCDVFLGSGKYGPYIKINENNIWRYTSLYNLAPNLITLDKAQELLEYPKYLKSTNVKDKDIILNNGKYGLYLRFNNKNYSITNIDYKLINYEYAKKIIDKHK
jgi:DNA topoisomerase-1